MLIPSEEEVKKGIENQEFVLFYQPYFDNDLDDIFRSEAFLRWVKPESNILTAAQFLPTITGNSELSLQMDSLVLSLAEQMVSNLSQINRNGFQLSVNLFSWLAKDTVHSLLADVRNSQISTFLYHS